MANPATMALSWTIALAVVVWMQLAGSHFGLYRTFDSPDGRYRVEVWRQQMDFAMPGQSGDAPGVVRLVYAASGGVLAEMPVDMVQLVEEVDWSEGHARIKLIVDWDLAALVPR